MSASSPAPSDHATPVAGLLLDSSILRVLMDSIPDHIYFKDRESRFVRNNPSHARSLGDCTPEECIGKTDYDFFAREHADRAFLDELRILATGNPIIGQVERVTHLDGRVFWMSTTKLPWRDAEGRIIGTFGLTRNVTDLKLAEDTLTNERNLLRTIIDHLPSRVFVKDGEYRYILNNHAHLEALGLKTQKDAVGRTTLDFFPGERGRQAIADDQQVIASGRPVLNQEKSDFGAEGHVHWSLTTKVPLRDAQGHITGLVGISHDITRRKLAEEELQRRNAEVEADVRMARQIQETFLPRTYPVFPRGVPAEASAIRFAHRYIPATTLGGDFFHIVQLSDTLCGVLICDVMGHGVRAGLLTALIRGVVEEMDDRATDPAHVLSEINRSLSPILVQTGEPVFATAFFGVVDTEKGTLIYANAGHPAPLVRRGDTGSILALTPVNPEPAAGLLAGFVYSRHECAFGAGDLLLGYTDGVIEAADARGHFFGEERLSAVLSHSLALTSEEICSNLVNEIAAFSGRAVFEDDVCVVAIESTGTTCVVQPISYDI